MKFTQLFLLFSVVLSLQSASSSSTNNNNVGSVVGVDGKSKRILGLFPHFGYSHFKVFSPILRALAERGHNITVVTYIKDPKPPENYEELIIESNETVNIFSFDLFNPTRTLDVIINEYFLLHAEGQSSCEMFYNSGYVEKLLERHKANPYDLVIMEFFNTDCYLGVPYLMETQVIGISSCALMPWHYDRIGLPDTPSYLQSEFVGFPEHLNWQQRLLNFIQAKLNKLLYKWNTHYHDSKIIKKYLGIDIDVEQVAKILTSLVFVNQHYSLSGNRPKTQQNIEIGGVHIDEGSLQSPLPKEIENFLNSVKPGERVIFISFGSLLKTSSMETEKLNTIFQAIESFAFKVIWKWENDKRPKENDKILYVKWAPQFQLICHPKVNFFWGHGGLLGTTEGVYCGKPLILTPIYGDQFLNAFAVQNRKAGVILNYQDIDEAHVRNVFQEILRPRYKENAILLSRIFRDRPRSPLNESIWWIEHLLKYGNNGGDLLKTDAFNLHWFIYHSFDSISIIIVGFLISFTLLWYVITILVGFILRQRRKINKKLKIN